MDQSTIFRLDDTLPVDAPARADIYGAVHKGLRAFMFDTLVRLGSTDAADARQLGDTLAQARALLALMREHLEHENTFVHPAMEARRPGSTHVTADDHADHLQALGDIGAALDAVARTEAARRPAALHRLYLRCSRFVAENLEHMVIEETHNTAAMHDAYDDTEIGAIIQRLIAAIPPASAAVFHRWMFVGMSHDERVGMLRGMQAFAPPAVFEAEVARARDVLAPLDWGKLANALGVPAGAGLVEVW